MLHEDPEQIRHEERNTDATIMTIRWTQWSDKTAAAVKKQRSREDYCVSGCKSHMAVVVCGESL